MRRDATHRGSTAIRVIRAGLLVVAVASVLSASFFAFKYLTPAQEHHNAETLAVAVAFVALLGLAAVMWLLFDVREALQSVGKRSPEPGPADRQPTRDGDGSVATRPRARRTAPRPLR